MGVLDWFRSDKKASAVGGLRAGFGVGRPVYTAKASENRRAFAEESLKSVIAYAAIRTVAKSFASVPWYVGRENDEGELEAVPTPEFNRVWNAPNPMYAGAQFRELWATYFCIHGEGPIERVRAGQSVRELYTLEPERVGVVPGSLGLPVAYEYKGASGQTRRFPVSQTTGDSDVRFIKAANPVEPWRGLAPTFAGARALDANNAGAEWNAALLQNAAQPSGLLAPKGDAVLTTEQREALKQAVNDRVSGPRNAGKPLVLSGDMAWTTLSMTPQEMAFLEGNRETARQIALAYGVPPMLLGIPGDNTYSNQREARLALYDETVIPLLNLLADEMTAWLMPSFGEGLKLCPDYDAIEALDYRRERKWDRIQQADFLELDEKRAALGYEPLGPERGGNLVPAVQQYAGLSLDMDEPAQAGRRAYGSAEPE